MNLETIKQSEVSQKEKNKYCILMHIYGIYKDVTDEPFAAQQWRCRNREQTCSLDTVGEGEDKTSWESSIETYFSEVKVKSLNRVQLFVTPWTVASQAPLSVGFSMQEYCSGLPFPSPGDLPNPGIEPRSPAL